MNCPNCQTNNPDNARYCARCGTLLEARGERLHVHEDQASSEPEAPQEPYPYPGEPTGRLAPRTLSELILETLAVYRCNFVAMLWLGLVANIPLFIALFPFGPELRAAITLGSLFTGLLADAAAVYAVGRWYIGRKTNASTSFVLALNNAPSLLLAFLVFGSAMLAGMILSFLFIGIPLLAFLLVVWLWYVQAIVIESKRPVESLRRSFELVRGNWWRVFGIGVAFVLLLFLATATASLPGILLGIKFRLLGDLVTTLGGVVVTPVAYIGATLVYFDLRVRKEGYTLETLATELGFSEDSPPPEPITPQP